MKKIFNFLSSFKFAGVVLVIIIVFSFVGSFIPQGVAESVHPKFSYLGYLQKWLDFSNIYSSPIFVFLIFLFGLSLFLRTLKLIPFAINGFQTHEKINFKFSKVICISEDDFIKEIKNLGWKIFPKNKDNTYKISKHSIGRFGVILIHFGIIIVMIGAFIGYKWGFNGFMNILEGDSDNVAVLPTGSYEPLGFDVRCDEFKVVYYDNSTRAKSYTSLISVLEGGKLVKKGVIDVNHPFKYKHLVFYQTNFGIYPNKNAKVIMNIENNGRQEEKKVGFGELFNINDNYSGKITDFAPTLAKDEEGRIFSSSDKLENPAVLLEVYKMNRPELRAWIIQKNGKSGEFKDIGFTIKFKDLYGVRYTGLSVKKDQGTPLIYIGFVLIIIGVILTYILNYTAIFFRIDNQDDKNILQYSLKEQRKHGILNPLSRFKKLIEGLGRHHNDGC